MTEITTDNEKAFIETLHSLFGVKLILGRQYGNVVKPDYEIRLMHTNGGYQFGMAEIDYINRRGSGIYSHDVEEIYLRAIDVEKRSKNSKWFLVQDCEHTINSVY